MIRSHRVGGWRLTGGAELKNENGELTDSTKRPSLLPALSFIQGGKSSYIQWQVSLKEKQGRCAFTKGEIGD